MTVPRNRLHAGRRQRLFEAKSQPARYGAGGVNVGRRRCSTAFALKGGDATEGRAVTGGILYARLAFRRFHLVAQRFS